MNSELKSKVDRLWTTFWNNGISNPLSVIEQISYLLFIKRLDELELLKERKATRLGKPVTDSLFPPDQKGCRWSYFKNLDDAEEMLYIVRDQAFPFIKTLGEKSEQNAYARHMKDAVFMIASPALLKSVVAQIDLIPMEDQDTKGDLYDKADAIRRKRQQAIALTEELLRSVFLDMFRDPVTNPKGWEMLTIENLLSEPLQNGAYFEKDRYVNDLTGGEMIHMSDAFYETIQRENLKRVNATSTEVKKYELKRDDILIARRSLNYEGSAKPCLISEETENPLMFESSLIRVRLKTHLIDPVFFFSYMLQPRARNKYVFPYVTKSTISGINQAGIKKIQVFIPPINSQKRYRQNYEKVCLLKKYNEQHLGIANNLFNSLLQRAFKGEL